MTRIPAALLLLGACTTTGTPDSGTPDPGPALQIIAVDVGQGDATLVLGADGSALLIDGGASRHVDALRTAVTNYAAGRLDQVVVTHFDADHLGGVVDLLLGPDKRAHTADDVASTAGIWDYGDDGTCTTQTCANYRTLRQSRGQQISVGQVLSVGGAEITCVAVNGRVLGGAQVAVADNENARSVALLIRYGNFRALVAGDLTGGLEGSPDLETPLARATGAIDVLHVNHHGSAASSNSTALALWAPLAAVISVGTDNSYCHPAAEVLSRLSSVGASIFSTGAGVQTPDTDCPTRTAWPVGARVLGNVEISAYQDGSFSVGGERLR